MNILTINRNYRNFSRLVKIVTVIGKYGFTSFLQRIRSGLAVLPERLFKHRALTEVRGLTEPQRIRLALEELGPTFIKIGQILSLRADILPEEYISELEKLQDSAPPVPFAEIKALIEKDFGCPLGTMFSDFDEIPHASGSVAQVHYAVLTTGEEVAVKVIKPGTREIVSRDMNVIRLLARLVIHYIPEIAEYNIMEIIDEMEETLSKELDLVREAGIMERFREIFRDDEWIRIPAVFGDLNSQNVLIMERVDGVKITDLEGLKNLGVDTKMIAENGARMALKALFEYGYFHADPHPGNMFVSKEGVIIPVDFGITGYLDREDILIMANIMLGLFNRDPDRIIRFLQRYDFIGDEVNIRKLKIDLLDLMDSQGIITSIGSFNTSIIKVLYPVTRKYRIKFPGEYFLMLKTLIQAESVAKKIYPPFNISRIAKEYVNEWLSKRGRFVSSSREILELLEDVQYFFRFIPAEIGTLLRRLRFGRVRLPLYHENLDRAVQEMDKIGNRLSFSIIIASLLLSSSIIVQARIGPIVRGYPLIGLVGFFAAAVFGIWLLVGIIRSGRL